MPVSAPSAQRLNDAFLASFTATWRAQGMAERTASEYCRHVRMFARTISGSLRDATRQDIERFIGDELVRCSPASASFSQRALKAFYRWLTLEEEVEIDPAAKTKAVRVPEPATKIADPDDIRKLIAATRGKRVALFVDWRARALVHILRSTGARISEVSRIKIEDIDLALGVILVPITKTRKPRFICLDADALRAVTAYLNWLPQKTTGIMWRTEQNAVLSLDGKP